MYCFQTGQSWDLSVRPTARSKARLHSVWHFEARSPKRKSSSVSGKQLNWFPMENELWIEVWELEADSSLALLSLSTNIQDPSLLWPSPGSSSGSLLQFPESSLVSEWGVRSIKASKAQQLSHLWIQTSIPSTFSSDLLSDLLSILSIHSHLSILHPISQQKNQSSRVLNSFSPSNHWSLSSHV